MKLFRKTHAIYPKHGSYTEIPGIQNIMMPGFQMDHNCPWHMSGWQQGKSTVADKKWSDTIKKGNVISQDIAAGEKIEEGNTISVIISKGIEQVKVPNVEGKTLEEAKKALKNAKLKADSTSTYSDSVAEGKVIDQSIKAGTTVDKNKTVTVTISLGKKPEPVYTAPSRSSSSSSRSSSKSRSSSSRSSSRKSGGSSKKKSSGGGSSLNKWNLVN